MDAIMRINRAKVCIITLPKLKVSAKAPAIKTSTANKMNLPFQRIFASIDLKDWSAKRAPVIMAVMMVNMKKK